MKCNLTKSRMVGPIENSDGAFEIMATSADGRHLELARLFISRGAAEAWIKKFPEGEIYNEDASAVQINATG